MNELANDPPEGIRVIINEQDITDIQAVIDGPGEYHPGGNYFYDKLRRSTRKILECNLDNLL